MICLLGALAVVAIVAAVVVSEHLILKALGYYESDWGDDT